MSLLSTVLAARASDPPVAGTLREGWPYIFGPAVLGLLLWRWRPLAGLGVMAAGAAISTFFRDPVRYLDPEPDLLYSPADGTVIGVDVVEDPWFIGRPAHRVSIFLSVLNVHVNRSPVAGTISAIRDLGTGFAPAMNFDKSNHNRRREIGLNTERGPILVVQVAGLLARRIVGWVDEQEYVGAGQKIGMITFGSRTDLIVPTDAGLPLVSIGDKVVGGRTAIARWL